MSEETRRQARSRRQQRYRQRRRKGLLVVRVLLSREDLEMLVNVGFLDPDRRTDRRAIAASAQSIIDTALNGLEEKHFAP